MEPTRNPHLVIDRIILTASVLLLGASITYAEVARPNWDQLFRIEKKTATTSAPASSNTSDNKAATDTKTATPATPAPAAPAVTTPPAAPAVKTTTTVSFVHMRAGKSTATPILFDLDAGTTVILRDDSDSTWQGVTYQGKDGYIYKSYLQY